MLVTKHASLYMSSLAAVTAVRMLQWIPSARVRARCARSEPYLARIVAIRCFQQQQCADSSSAGRVSVSRASYSLETSCSLCCLAFNFYKSLLPAAAGARDVFFSMQDVMRQ